MAGTASKLIKDLNDVPSIVASLGLAVAEAQKAFNLDYLENVERLLGLIRSVLAPQAAKGELGDLEKQRLAEAEASLKSLLAELAPSRYQFTETTLAVKLDLAQTMNLAAESGFSAALGAVAVNASMTVGYGYDYRAAAEVRTVLHAIPADRSVTDALLGRAEDLSDKALVLPPAAAVDQAIVEKTHELVTKMADLTTELKKPAPPKQ